jgi:adenine-specific DNA-methyltransferase
MANSKTRLELTWIGKENRPRLEPRILLEDPAKSYHAKHRVKKGNPQITRISADSNPNNNVRESAQSAAEEWLSGFMSGLQGLPIDNAM